MCWGVLGGHRTPHIIIFMAMIYYSEKTQTRINKGKARGTKSGRNQMQASKSLLPAKSHRMCWTSQAWHETARVYLQGKLISDLAPTVAPGVPLLACAKIPDSQNENSFSTRRVICRKSFGTVSHPYGEMLGTLLKSTFPDTSQGSTYEQAP